MATTKSDLEIWREDDVRQCGIDRVPISFNVTAEECGVAGGVSDYLRLADDDSKEGRDARVKLGRLAHILLNLMRAHSDVPFTDEPDPSKWALADQTQTIKTPGKRQKRVAGSGTGVNGADQFVTEEYVKSERGYGNDTLVNKNPPNFDGVQNTNDAKPGWWYRMVYLPENRDTVLGILHFFNPDECDTPARAARLMDPEKNPRRKKALEVIELTKAMPDEAFVPKRTRKAVSAT